MSEPLPSEPVRHRLPDERRSIRHSFRVGRVECEITVSFFPKDGRPGELFVAVDDRPAGTDPEVVSARGFVDAAAYLTSLLLQFGVPLEVPMRKMVGTRFSPSGFTGNPLIPYASSILDYVARWCLLKFYPEYAETLGAGDTSHASALVP